MTTTNPSDKAAEPSLYWHDYETWGANPSVDRPSQFAGLRTNLDLEVIAEPDMWYCKPTADTVPHPRAIAITGITPNVAEEKGLSEPHFIAKVHERLSEPMTCGVGYNSLRFDDEVTRYTLYRNFYDPYAREWQGGNSRWDIIDLVRTCYALRPEGIEWPMIDGRPSFKLEHLSAANDLMHASAHDALSDVEATIALAKLIKDKQPKLYHHLFELRKKTAVASAIDVINRKPLLHISSRFSAEHGCAGLVMPLARHPKNSNAIIVVDLAAPPEDLITLGAEKIAERVFTSRENLPEGCERIPLKAIHLNKCPVVLTPKLLTGAAASRLNIDKDKAHEHWQTYLQHDLAAKVAQVFELSEFAASPDAEQQLYSGFIPNRDKPTMVSVREGASVREAISVREEASARESAGQASVSAERLFNDARLNDLWLRYRGRHYPHLLSPAESKAWLAICENRWQGGSEGYLSLAEFYAEINSIVEEGASASLKNQLSAASEWVKCGINTIRNTATDE